jgi:hypothetical protein
MVYHHISEDMKNWVLWLLDNGVLPDVYDVVEIFGVSEQSSSLRKDSRTYRESK